MKKLVLALSAAAILMAGCATGNIKPSEPKWASTFPSVPIEERIGGEWTGGPPSTK